MPRVHAFADDALGHDDAVGLRERLQRGEVSAAELVEAAVARAERLQPELNAVAYQAFDRALAESRRPRPGFFSGIPTFVKDNADVAGMPTQQGTRSYRAAPAKADGDFARMYRRLGLFTLGKTQLSEFGFSASAEYPADWGWDPVRNPWDTSRTSGASSAGSAAFVAAGVVPISHANDGGGSIRIPAACCGLVGLKPTRGRTPSDKMHREMPVRIVHDGVVTRSVRDTAAFLRESERIYRDLRLPPVGDVTGPSRKRLRIGVVTDSVGARRTDPECVRAVEDTAALLSDAGHHVVSADVPVGEEFAADFSLYWSMLAAFLCDTGKATLGRDFDKRRTDNLTRGLARMTHRNPHRLPGAIRRLRRSTRESRAYYAERGLDVVLSPVLAEPPLPLGELQPDQPFEDVFGRLLEWVTFTPLHNATGDPAMSLPLGRTTDGMPLGVMISAPHGADATLLGLAFELERLQPFSTIDG